VKSNIISLAVALVGLCAAAVAFWRQPWTPLRIAGAVIGVSSFILLAVARVQLGASFSIRAKAYKLVTHGLYSKIRNPIYVFGGLVAVGVFLFMNRPQWLLIFVVLIPMQIVRARREEKVLTEKFGEEYRQYKERTWF
jgi:protein-S-isoprenylcysteine O-methyltransferase Ste14